MFNEVKIVLDEFSMLMINCLLIMFIMKGLILITSGISKCVFKLCVLGGILSISSTLTFLFINTFITKSIKIFTILVMLQAILNGIIAFFLKEKRFKFKNRVIKNLIINLFFSSCISNIILVAISIRCILFNYINIIK